MAVGAATCAALTSLARRARAERNWAIGSLLQHVPMWRPPYARPRQQAAIAPAEPIAQAAAALEAEGALAVYVFGSFADGTARSDSDLGAAVSGFPPARFFAATGEALAAAAGTGRMVDVIELDAATPFTEYPRTSGSLRHVG